MKLNKLVLMSVLSCFALPLVGADAPKVEKAPEKAAKAPKKKKAAHHSAAHHEPALPTEPTVVASAPAADSNTSLAIHGKVWSVMNYDLNGFGGDYLNVGAIPFDKDTIGDKQKQVLSGNIKASRLAFTSTTKTPKGEMKAHIEGDFYGQSTPTSYEASEPNGSSSLVFRVRKAYADLCCLRIGRDDSLFVTYPQIDTVDFSGQFGGGLRPMQVRYTHKFSDVVTGAVGVERTTTDAVMPNGTSVSSAGIIREQNLPDVLGKISAKIGDHEFGLRGVFRFASISNPAGTITKSTQGYGIGGDVKLAFMKKTMIIGVVNYGQGIGQQISENYGLSYVVDTTNEALKAQTMIEYGAGVSHAFNDQWTANLSFSQSTVTKDASFDPATAATKDLQRFFGNVMYSPMKDLSFGLEYAQGNRTSQTSTVTTTAQKGTRQRVVFGVIYKF